MSARQRAPHWTKSPTNHKRITIEQQAALGRTAEQAAAALSVPLADVLAVWEQMDRLHREAS